MHSSLMSLLVSQHDAFVQRHEYHKNGSCYTIGSATYNKLIGDPVKYVIFETPALPTEINLVYAGLVFVDCT